MMSLSQFRKHIFESWKLMTEAEAEFEIYHRRKIYKLKVIPTGQKVTRPYKKRISKSIIPPLLINSTPCDACDSLLINGVCMNKVCPKYSLR